MSMSGAAGSGPIHFRRQRGVTFRCCKAMEPPEAANNLRLGPETCCVPCFVSVESGSSIQGFRGALATNDSVETLAHYEQTYMKIVLSRMLMMTKYKHATDISYPLSFRLFLFAPLCPARCGLLMFIGSWRPEYRKHSRN